MYGVPNKDCSNVVWVIHPFTATSDVGTWWSSIIAPSKVIDTNKYCIVSANVLGSPYGSTYPLEINPNTQEKYYYDFPVLTPRDVIDSFEFLRIHLKIPQIKILLGASMGGQLALQWLVSYPKSVLYSIIVGANAKMSSWMQAMHIVQQNIIELDPTWGEKHDDAGKAGMSIARQTAVISYRSAKIFELSQIQQHVMSNSADEQDDDNAFNNVSSYLGYQGEKFTTRFNAFSYLSLLRMMNEHNIAYGYESLSHAIKKIQAGVLFIGIDSDLVFPAQKIQKLCQQCLHAVYREISSVYGHDAFLIEFQQLEDIIHDYLGQVGE